MLITRTQSEQIDDQAERSASLRTQKKARNLWKMILATVALMIGIVLLLYPVIATCIMNYSQAKSVDIIESSLREQAEQRNVGQTNVEMDKARNYNSKLHNGPILDPLLQRVAPDTEIYRNYLTYLNTASAMATLQIPSIKVKLPIYHGTFDDTLEKGAGHLFGTSLPVGGESTHAVITAHSGLGNATMFDHLGEMSPGDPLYIFVAGERLKYEVVSTEVVEPHQTDSLYIRKGKDMVTLITCTPYGINTHRLLVHAERAPMTHEDEKSLESSTYPIFKLWMLIPAIAIITALTMIVVFTILVHKRRRQRPKRAYENETIDDMAQIDSEITTDMQENN